MQVSLYSGCFSLVQKSGVGQAILHQMAVLNQIGIKPMNKLTKDSDIIHINTVFPDSPVVAWLAKKLHKKVIYYGHSTMEDFRNSFKFSNLLAPLFRRWIIFCYSLGDIIITPTPYSQKLLKSYGITKPIYYLSNGIDTDFFAPSKQRKTAFRKKYKLAPNEKAVISVGHYIERKGILDFIVLAQSMPSVRFFWFGYTNLNLVPRHIRTAIKNAPKNLTFPGYVNKEKIRDAYCGCDLFAFMSTEETEGIVVLEALACGSPILVRDIPVYEDWLINEKNVYKASSLFEFYTQTKDILSGTLPNLAAQGRQVALDRNLEKIGFQLQKIYQKLMQQTYPQNRKANESVSKACYL